MERAIMEAVARADLILCQIGSLPWHRLLVLICVSVCAVYARKRWLD